MWKSKEKETREFEKKWKHNLVQWDFVFSNRKIPSENASLLVRKKILFVGSVRMMIWILLQLAAESINAKKSTQETLDAIQSTKKYGNVACRSNVLSRKNYSNYRNKCMKCSANRTWPISNHTTFTVVFYWFLKKGDGIYNFGAGPATVVMVGRAVGKTQNPTRTRNDFTAHWLFVHRICTVHIMSRM